MDVHAAMARSGSGPAQSSWPGAAASAWIPLSTRTSKGMIVRRHGRELARIAGPPRIPLSTRAICNLDREDTLRHISIQRRQITVKVWHEPLQDARGDEDGGCRGSRTPACALADAHQPLFRFPLSTRCG